MNCEVCGNEHITLVGWKSIEGDEIYVAVEVLCCENCKHEQEGRALSKIDLMHAVMSEFGDDWKPADFSAGWEV